MAASFSIGNVSMAATVTVAVLTLAPWTEQHKWNSSYLLSLSPGNQGNAPNCLPRHLVCYNNNRISLISRCPAQGAKISEVTAAVVWHFVISNMANVNQALDLNLKVNHKPLSREH